MGYLSIQKKMYNRSNDNSNEQLLQSRMFLSSRVHLLCHQEANKSLYSNMFSIKPLDSGSLS